MVLTIVEIGLSFVRWNVRGPVVAEGGVTEALTLRRPLVVASPSISRTMMAVAVQGAPLFERYRATLSGDDLKPQQGRSCYGRVRVAMSLLNPAPDREKSNMIARFC